MKSNFVLYPLQEFLDKFSSNQVKKILKTFKCNLNQDVVDFLYNKSITFEKKLRAKTYLLIEQETKKIAGYFTIAISVLYAKEIDKEVLFKIGDLNNTKDIPCFLIGQLAKSDKFQNKKLGSYIMKSALNKLKEANKIVGGRFILLDAVNNEKVIKFYEEFGFFKIEHSTKENIKMIKPFYEKD